MTNVIILHGKPDDDEYYDSAYPSSSNSHWLPWLQNHCLINNIPASTPEIPWVYKATYEEWKKEFERNDITPETIVVTHSCGGGFLFRYLGENKDVRIKKWIAVAPWLDPFDFMKKTFDNDFFDFERDPDILECIETAIIFHSDNDMDSIQQSLDEIKQVWPAFPIREFHNYGHFCLGDMGTTEFPELLAEVLV